MKKQQGKSLSLRLIQGGRDDLEKRLRQEMAEGRINQNALDSLRPKGDLRLAQPATKPKSDQDDQWLNCDDSNG